MNILLKDKIKIDKNFIDDLIVKSWQDSESIQNQIDSIEVDSPQAAKVVKLLKDLLTSYYVFTGCLENIEHEQISSIEPEPEQEETIVVPNIDLLDTNMVGEIGEFTLKDERSDANDDVNEPFEYFVDFDEPIGDPLTDEDLYT